MLEIQKFLQNTTPAELTTQLGIKVKHHPVYPNLMHFSYDQIESPKAHPIVQECRGIILDSANNWKVIAYPFNRFPNYGEQWGGAIDWTNVRVQEKVDGCYPHSTLLPLWGGGTIKLGKVVTHRLVPDLIGMDKCGNLVKCTPTAWYNNGKKRHWVRIETEHIGKSRGTLVVTPNHELFINGDFRPAIEASPGDIMLRHSQAPCPSVLHLIRSSLLGDGSISPVYKDTFRFSTAHVSKYPEFNEFFLKSLGAFAVSPRSLTSGFGSAMTQVSSVTTRTLKPLRDQWYPHGKRVLPDDLSWIDAFSLAVLYMDNGSISYSDKQEDRAIISCNYMSEYDCTRLADKIYELCGVDCVVFPSKGMNIRINANPESFGQKVTEMILKGMSCVEVIAATGCSKGTYYWYKKNPNTDRPLSHISAFWEMIAPHVVPCMRYKLPNLYRDAPYQEYAEGTQHYVTIPVKIKKVTQFEATPQTMPFGSVGYDIETTTGNYIAQGLLGHNSLLVLWHYAGTWNVSTKGSPDAGGTVGDYNFTFSDLFWKTLETHLAISNDVNMVKFNPLHTYMIELTSIYNRVVCSYGKDTKLTLIGIRDITVHPYREFLIHEYQWFGPSPLPPVGEYPLNSVEDIIKAAESLNPMQNEGFVVVDGNFNRVKIKSPSYVMIHHLKEGMFQRRIIRLIQLGEQSEVLSYFPEYQEMFTEIQALIDAKLAEIEIDYHRIKHLTDRKEFALEATKTSCPDVLFGLYTGAGTDVREYVLHSKKVIRKATATIPAIEDFRFSEEKIERMIGLKSKEPVPAGAE